MVFMCCTAIRRMVSLSNLDFMALQVGIMPLNSCMYVFIFSRLFFSIALWVCLVKMKLVTSSLSSSSVLKPDDFLPHHRIIKSSLICTASGVFVEDHINTLLSVGFGPDCDFLFKTLLIIFLRNDHFYVSEVHQFKWQLD